MRLIDADELLEHAYRDRLDSRELIADMINNAPTVKEIPTKIPIDIFEKLVSQEPKTGHWIDMDESFSPYECSECKSVEFKKSKYCPNCRAKLERVQE